MQPELIVSAAGLVAGALNTMGAGVSSVQANAVGTVALLSGGYLGAWALRGRDRRFDSIGLVPRIAEHAAERYQQPAAPVRVRIPPPALAGVTASPPAGR